MPSDDDRRPFDSGGIAKEPYVISLVHLRLCARGPWSTSDSVLRPAAQTGFMALPNHKQMVEVP